MLLLSLALSPRPAYALRAGLEGHESEVGRALSTRSTSAAGLEEPWAIVKKRMGSDVRFYGPTDVIGRGFVNELKRVNNPDHPIRWSLGRMEPAFGVRWTVSGPTRSALPTLAALKRHERQLTRRFEEPSLTIHASKPRRDATGQYSRQITLYGVAVYDYNIDDETTNRLIRSLIVALTRQLRSSTQLAISKPTIGFPPETVRLLSARLIGVRIVDHQRSRHAGVEEKVQYYWDVSRAIEAHPILRDEVARREAGGRVLDGVLALPGGLRFYRMFRFGSHEARVASNLLTDCSMIAGHIDIETLPEGKVGQQWDSLDVVLADRAAAQRLRVQFKKPSVIIDLSDMNTIPRLAALLPKIWHSKAPPGRPGQPLDAWVDPQTNTLFLFRYA